MTAAENAPAGSAIPPGVHDHQIDNVPRRFRRRPPALDPYQRLVTNPFLAFLGWILWFALVRLSLRSGLLPYFFAAIASFILPAFLLQYHCLDCGRTGRLARWREHACERVLARQAAGRPRWIRGPTPPVQALLWFLATVFAGILWLLVSV
jgi:hypothetical protein